MQRFKVSVTAHNQELSIWDAEMDQILWRTCGSIKSWHQTTAEIVIKGETIITDGAIGAIFYFVLELESTNEAASYILICLFDSCLVEIN